LLRRSGIEMAIPSTGKFILVNIPSYELVALQDGEPVLRSRVVVGKPATPTPELTASMVIIRFNPDWTPTPSMVRNEGLQYMPPGPQNPLGRMMFALDNDDLIYLHDTNEKQLFNRGQRALSHGCIRVQQARALAAWSLGVLGESNRFHGRARVDLRRASAGGHPGRARLFNALSRPAWRDYVLSGRLFASDSASGVMRYLSPRIQGPFTFPALSL